MSKLAIGTVQFGLNYGIANQTGKIKLSDAEDIFKLAKKTKIDLIDTAIQYGDSEKIIGKIGTNGFKIITKLPSSPKNCLDIDFWLEKNVLSSLNRLCVKSLYGLLIRSPYELKGDKGRDYIKALKKIKAKGFVKKIGISIYDPKELDDLMQLIKFDIVQSPLNIIDRRLEKSGWLSKLYEEGVEVHTRSSFLQGLLLMPRKKIPIQFNQWSSIWDRWFSELSKNNLNAAEVCLSYPLLLPEVNYVIIGVDSYDQFKSLIKISNNKLQQRNWEFMVSNDQMLINPNNWKKL